MAHDLVVAQDTEASTTGVSWGVPTGTGACVPVQLPLRSCSIRPARLFDWLVKLPTPKQVPAAGQVSWRGATEGSVAAVPGSGAWTGVQVLVAERPVRLWPAWLVPVAATAAAPVPRLRPQPSTHTASREMRSRGDRRRAGFGRIIGRGGPSVLVKARPSSDLAELVGGATLLAGSR